MNNTRIFVSSTCYDLAALREDIRAMIIGMGHEPLLSEYSSFPVNPDEKAIANCRRNVREHSDIFVLVIGGCRGSLDPDTKRPVTNLEYQEAITCGLPVYVFISRPVLTLLHVWRKNPNADFTPAVDYPEVFAFIASIQKAGVWTFPFDRTDEIKEALRTQLSGLFKGLLERRRGGKLDPLPEFSGESKRAAQLALDKPTYWEYLLTAELLRNRLSVVRRRHNDVVAGLVHQSLLPIKASEVQDWVMLKSDEMHTIIKRFEPAYNAIMVSWGEPGVSGDPSEIKSAVDKLASFAQDIVNWEVEVRRMHPPKHLVKLVSSLVDFRTGLLEKLESIPQQIDQFFAGDPQPGSELKVHIVLDAPPMDGFFSELERLNKIPSAFVN